MRLGVELSNSFDVFPETASCQGLSFFHLGTSFLDELHLKCLTLLPK